MGGTPWTNVVWSDWATYGDPVSFEGVNGYNNPTVAAGFVGILLSTGRITFATFTPYGTTWPEPFPLGGYFEVKLAVLTVDLVLASSDPGGKGTLYTLTPTLESGTIYLDGSNPKSGVPSLLSMLVNNPTDGQELYIYSIQGTAQRYYRTGTVQTITPPTTAPPTGTPPSSPPSSLDKANPGFVCDLGRLEHYEDLGTVELGQKIALTIPDLGFVNRGMVVTGIKIDAMGTSDQGTGPQFTLECTYTLEKIPGTLLPGAGTSSAAQDAAGTGAELSQYLHFADTTSGFGLGSFEP